MKKVYKSGYRETSKEVLEILLKYTEKSIIELIFNELEDFKVNNFSLKKLHTSRKIGEAFLSHNISPVIHTSSMRLGMKWHSLWRTLVVNFCELHNKNIKSKNWVNIHCLAVHLTNKDQYSFSVELVYDKRQIRQKPKRAEENVGFSLTQCQG